SQKLANAANTAGVEKVSVNPDGTIVFPATVNFNPTPGFTLTPGPAGFPPAAASLPAVGGPGYSPLIQLPDGVVENAPQVANTTGQATKVVSIDFAHKTVTYKETGGFQGGKALRYASFDSSDPAAAAIEHVTYAPALNNLPTLNDDSTASARASLAGFTNGQTGAANPNRQGLNSAILDGLDPLNVLRWNPTQGRYSPIWDAHLTQWQVPPGQRTLQTDLGTVQGLPHHRTLARVNGTAPGTTFAPRPTPSAAAAPSDSRRSAASASPAHTGGKPAASSGPPGPSHPVAPRAARNVINRHHETGLATPGGTGGVTGPRACSPPPPGQSE